MSYVPKLIRIEEPGDEKADPAQAESGPKDRTGEEEAAPDAESDALLPRRPITGT